MAFLEKEDYCGIAGDSVEAKSVTVGTSAGLNETPNGNGEIVDQHVFGEVDAPSVTYVIKADWDLSTVKLGQVAEVDGKKFALQSITINTSVGEPQISASAVQVEESATVGGGDWVIPACTVTPMHEVQNLLGCFEIEGDGNYEQSANYTIQASVAPHTKDGLPLAHGSSLGQITCALTIAQIGEVKPTVKPGEGWKIVSPLALTNNDSSEPSWVVTLSYPLKKVDAQ
jgi:hypothetical protein